ncbi:MAG: hypothetical protein C4337_08375 [Armatimonadota bacterium]
MATENRAARTTEQEHWVEYYGSRTRDDNGYTDIDESDFRNWPYASLMSYLSRYMTGDAVIEIGAGDSQLLIDVKKRFNPKRVVGLDYLPQACDLLRLRAEKAGVSVEVVCADMYTPPDSLVGNFDMVMSYGVVEHFTDLPDVIAAISRFAKPGGIVFTLIPNLKGSIYQKLMRSWNKKVYDAHVPYDPKDLDNAHRSAGLQVIECRYFMSSNFGMLSWCFSNKPKSGWQYQLYVQLTRLSKMIWFFEKRFFAWPSTKLFSPYIVCVAKKI